MAVFLKECYLQKTNQFEALEVLRDADALRVSTELQFLLENNGGKKIVEVYTQGNENERKKIGVLNEDDAKDIVKFIDAGWNGNSLFKCIVCRYDDKADENKRISVAISIIEKPQ